jgi:hypothetical protein
MAIVMMKLTPMPYRSMRIPPRTAEPDQVRLLTDSNELHLMRCKDGTVSITALFVKGYERERER